MMNEYHAIWIERRSTPLTTLWETSYSEAYTLVDNDHVPLHDSENREYRFRTIAQAEAKIRELLAPLLCALARAYAEEGHVLC